jgi:cobalamin 5'-phosphate synthase/cobalamin synthase
MRAARALAAAVAFLTRVPVGRLAAFDGEDVARAAPLYPAVGAAVGAAGGAVADALAGPLPALVAAALGVAVLAVVTGALHLDALADTADAIGGATRERRLEIMRDHAIGAFGATALALILVLEVAAVAALAERGLALESLVAAGAVSRWAPLPVAAVLPYARPEGQAGVLAERSGLGASTVGLAVAAGLAAAALRLDGLALVAAAGAVAVLAALACRAWLGGVTGDTLGATTQLAEAAALVVALALA